MPRDLQGVLEAVLAGVIVLDREGRVELLNSAACRILETSSRSAAGRPLASLVGEARAIPELVHEVAAHGRAATRGGLVLSRRFDDDLELDATVSPLYDDEGGRDGLVVVLRDRTLQRSLEELAAQRERLEALGQIAAGIAHEVRNPLGGIRGAAEILGARSQDAKSKDAAALVVREVDRISALLDDFMVFARGDVLDLRPTNIHRVLDDVLDLLAHDPMTTGIELERVYDPSVPDLAADEKRLTQVFLNLARNALQAMEGSGGSLRIETRVPMDQRLSSADGRPVPTVVVRVIDTGPGIPREVLHQMETPFFTTRASGTGLGLAVARHWVALHGGSLQLDSQVGAGTAVRVMLPLWSGDRG